MFPMLFSSISSCLHPGNRQEFRKLGKIGVNFSTRIMGNAVNKLFGLVTLPIIARALGPEYYGQFNLIMIILGYIVFFADFGHSVYGIRESAKQPNAHTIVSQLFSARLTTTFISILISLLVLFIFFKQNLGWHAPIYIGFIWVFAQGINIDYYYFGKANMLVPTLSQMSGQVLYVVLVILFIKQPRHLSLLVLFYSLYYLWASCLGVILYTQKNGRIKAVISFKEAWAVLKKTFRLGICARIVLFQNSYPVIIISAFLGTYFVGLFYAAFKFFSITLLIFEAMMLTLTPYLAKIPNLNPDLQRKYIQFMAAAILTIGILISTFLYIGGEMIMVLLFGNAFAAATPIFKLICLTLIPFWPLNMLLNSILIYFDLDKKYLFSSLISGLVSFISAPLFIHVISLTGAVWSMFFANFTAIIISAYYVNQVVPILTVPVKKKGIILP